MSSVPTFTSRGTFLCAAGALAMRAAGIDIRKLRAVVFNSGGESMTALLGAHIDAAASAPSGMLAQLRTGKLRLLVVGAPKRNDLVNVYKNSAETAAHWKAEYDEVKGVLIELGLAK